MKLKEFLKILAMPFVFAVGVLAIGVAILADWFRFNLIVTDWGRCPECGAELIKRGYPKDGFVQYYKCPECD